MDDYQHLISCCESIASISLSTRTRNDLEEQGIPFSVQSKILQQENLSRWLDSDISNMEVLISSHENYRGKPLSDKAELEEQLIDDSFRLSNEILFLKRLVGAQIAQQPKNQDYRSIVRHHAHRARDLEAGKTLAVRRELHTISEDDLRKELSGLASEIRSLYGKWKENYVQETSLEKQVTSNEVLMRVTGDLLLGSGLALADDPRLQRIVLGLDR